MDIFASPLITITLNIVAQGLVSRGILDVHNKDTVVQLVQQAIVAFGTLVVAVYSISKAVDLQKHRLTLANDKALSGQTAVSAVVTTGTSTSYGIANGKVDQQTGLPIGQ